MTDQWLDKLSPDRRAAIEQICEQAGTWDADSQVLIAAADLLIASRKVDFRPHRGNKYLSELIRFRCGPDMLLQRLFPNSKEVTESFAAFHAAMKIPGLDAHDAQVNVVVVGDGGTPRTAATFAYRTQWACVSVDPQLNTRKDWDAAINRLVVFPVRIEETSFDLRNRTLVVAVHSHANLAVAVSRIKAPRLDVIAIPCCVEQKLACEPTWELVDSHIMSPHNRILVWEDYRAC